jgi:hypothetical protein
MPDPTPAQVLSASIPRDQARQRLLLQRPLAAAKTFLNRSHVGVEHRGQVQRDELRKEQAADYHQAQWLPRFAARAVAQGDRDGALELGGNGIRQLACGQGLDARRDVAEGSARLEIE